MGKKEKQDVSKGDKAGLRGVQAGPVVFFKQAGMTLLCLWDA